MLICGIDPGLKGGITIIDHDGKMVEMIVMPIVANETDAHGVAKFLKKYDTAIGWIFIEHAQSMPKQSVSAMFNYGTSFGKLIGVSAALGIRYMLVKPQRWQEQMLLGTDTSLDTKKRGFLACTRIFPGSSFQVCEGRANAAKFHDGLTDATLIAEYGRRFIQGKFL